MHDYPAFRFIHQDLSGDAFRDAMRLTFEYYIALTDLAGDKIFGCWHGDELVGGMLVRLPGAVDSFDPEHPVTVEYIKKTGNDTWQRLEAFEVMMANNETTPDEGCFYIDLIGVKPGAHGKGYGRFMLDHIAELARQHPATSFVCLATESPEKRAFYEHFGYKKVSTASIGPVTSTSYQLNSADT